MTGPDPDHQRLSKRHARGMWAWSVALICVIGTLATWVVVLDHERQNNSGRFDALVRETRLAVAERLTYYTAALRGAQGLFATADYVSPAMWRSYVDSLDLATHYPGITGLGYIPLVNGPMELSQLQKQLTAWGERPLTLLPPGDRDQYRPMSMIEPVDDNRGALGMDFTPSQPFRFAMDYAAETGLPAMTPKIELPYLTPSAAVVMCLPVYRPGAPLDSAANRREATLGWVCSSLRVSELMQGLNSQRLSNISIAIYDERADINHLLYVADLRHQKGPYTALLELPVAGRVWWMGFDSTPEFETRSFTSNSSLVLPTGLSIAAILGLLTWSLASTGIRAEELAAKKTEALNRSERELRLFIEHSPAAVAMFDRELRHLNVSRRWITDYGLQGQTLIGKTHYEVFPEVAGHWKEIHRRCLLGAVESNPSEPFRRSDGSIMWLRWEVRPWRIGDAPDAPIGGLVMLTQDITSERLAQEEAARASNLARWVLSATSEVAIIGTDPAGRITVFNVGASKMLGYSVKEAISGLNPADLHDPVEVERRREELNLALGMRVEGFDVFVEIARRIGAEEREWTFLRKDGSRLTVNLMVTASRDESGKIFGYIFVAVDVTKRKLAEAELVAAKVAAEASSRAKSAFLANMSHEIRTPMNGIIGMAELLLSTRLDALQREFAGTIRSSSQSLLTILNDILDYSKIEAGKLTIEWIDFDLHETITSAVELFREAAYAKGLTLDFTMSPDVPRVVRCDPLRLRQIIMNLVGNAVKFTLKGGIRVVATWDAAAAPPALQVEVQDTGIGIDQESLKTLFSPFTQADESTTRRFGGSGLGLTICQELAERMGGRIGVRSTPGEGSTFWFTITPEPSDEVFELPVSPRVGGHPSTLPERADAQPASSNGMHLLVVEDHPVNQRVLHLLLEQLGYAVTMASNGAEGVKAFKDGRFDAVLMDCQMPELDGYQATGQIRAFETASGRREHRTPIIAMTAHAMEGDRQRCLDAGMDDYLSKPVQVEALVAVLSQWLRPAHDPRDPAPAAVANPQPSDAATTQPPAAGERPILDEPRLRLVTGGKSAMLAEIVPMFQEQTGARIAAMRSALAASDAATVAREAHTAYGSCAMIGANAMAAVFKEVELKAKSGDLQPAGPGLRVLDALFPATMARLKAFRL